MSVVIFLVATFFSIPLVAVYGAEGDEYVCAEFAEPKEGQKADASTAGTKEVANQKEALEIVQKKKETKDTIINEDGKITIKSECGLKDTTGKVCFKFEGLDTCIDKKSDGSIDIQSEAVKRGVRDAVSEQVNKILENADRLRDPGALTKLLGGDDYKRYEELLRSLGVDSSSFIDAAQKNPDAIKDMLTNIAAGNVERAEEIARDIGFKLGVTSDQLHALAERAVSTFPKEVRDVVEKIASDLCATTGACSEIVSEITGFTAPGGPDTGSIGTAKGDSGRVRGEVRAPEKARQLFSPYQDTLNRALDTTSLPEKFKEALRNGGAAAIANSESGFNPRICAKSSSACGLFQFLSGTARDVGLRNPFDPNASTAAFARYADMNYKQIPHEMESAVSAGMDPIVAIYAAHNMGSGKGKSSRGAEDFLRAYVTNPNMSIERVLPESTVRNNCALYCGKTVAQAADSLASFLSADKTGFGAVAGRATQYLNGSVNSPLSLSSGGIGGLLKNLLGGGGLFGSSSGGSSGGGSFGGGGSSGSVSSDTSNSSSGSSAPQPLPPITVEQTPVDENAEPVAPSFSLVVHPGTAQKGESVSVIWSTVGVSTTRVCQLSAESTEGSGVIAEGNEGTKVIQVPVNTPLTELRFSLRCVPKDTRINPEDAQTSFILRIN